jgi:hypothetical protein
MFRQFDKKPYPPSIYSTPCSVLHKVVHSICAQPKSLGGTGT